MQKRETNCACAPIFEFANAQHAIRPRVRRCGFEGTLRPRPRGRAGDEACERWQPPRRSLDSPRLNKYQSCLHRHERLELRKLARLILQRTSQTGVACVLCRTLYRDRNQRNFLPLAKQSDLSAVARTNAGIVSVCHQGQPLPDTQQKARGSVARHTPGTQPRDRTRSQAGGCSLAASPSFSPPLRTTRTVCARVTKLGQCAPCS